MKPFEGCTAECAASVPCPFCGSPLPPRGRAMPLEMNIPACCDLARMDPAINTRHLWTADEIAPS